MRGHVDAESLALCAEGLLRRRQSERIRAHVDLCPECAAAQARLSEVPALLAQVPPPALPPVIAARLDAALSAEAARRAAHAPGLAPDYVPDHAPDQAAPARSPDAAPGPRGPRRRGLRLPVAARVLAVAGVLVVAGGVGYVVTQSSPSTSSSGSSALASGRGRAPQPGRQRPRRPGPRRPRLRRHHVHGDAQRNQLPAAHVPGPGGQGAGQLRYRPDPPRNPVGPARALQPDADRVRDQGGGCGARR